MELVINVLVELGYAMTWFAIGGLTAAKFI